MISRKHEKCMVVRDIGINSLARRKRKSVGALATETRATNLTSSGADAQPAWRPIFPAKKSLWSIKESKRERHFGERGMRAGRLRDCEMQERMQVVASPPRNESGPVSSLQSRYARVTARFSGRAGQRGRKGSKGSSLNSRSELHSRLVFPGPTHSSDEEPCFGTCFPLSSCWSVL